MQIAEIYLIPKILKDHNMNELQIFICKNTIKDISMYSYLLLSTVLCNSISIWFWLVQKYTKESGVRELQRKLEVICHYIAVDIVENGDKIIKNYVITPELLLNILDVSKKIMFLWNL